MADLDGTIVSKRVREYAPAKINLFLEVVGKRADGYHHLQSLMVFCDVGEYVEVAPAAISQFTIGGPMASGLMPGNDNLVQRAAKAFLNAAGLTQPVAIHLHKDMPVSSGIGGGSADAAATLRALDLLFNQPLSRSELLSISASLGADVPACFYSAPMCLNGVGAELTPADLAIEFSYIVLANPGVGMSTPAVFTALGAGPLPQVVPILDSKWTLAACINRRNDLMAPAVALCPQVQSCLDALTALPHVRLARMSGSGATCFAAFESEHHAASAVQGLRDRFPEWWIASGALQ
ncbi:MAG: 4-(cytidine 5'-diphospho)-2-C-methyl-D-erythritol kinase [Pseudomonadota bacterium]